MNIEDQIKELVEWVEVNSSYVTTDGCRYSEWKYVDTYDLLLKIKEIESNLGDVK